MLDGGSGWGVGKTGEQTNLPLGPSTRLHAAATTTTHSLIPLPSLHRTLYNLRYMMSPHHARPPHFTFPKTTTFPCSPSTHTPGFITTPLSTYSYSTTHVPCTMKDSTLVFPPPFLPSTVYFRHIFFFFTLPTPLHFTPVHHPQLSTKFPFDHTCHSFILSPTHTQPSSCKNYHNVSFLSYYNQLTHFPTPEPPHFRTFTPTGHPHSNLTPRLAPLRGIHIYTPLTCHLFSFPLNRKDKVWGIFCKTGILFFSNQHKKKN